MCPEKKTNLLSPALPPGREILSLLRTIASLEQTAVLVATHDPKVQGFTSTNYMLTDGLLQEVK